MCQVQRVLDGNGNDEHDLLIMTAAASPKIQQLTNDATKIDVSDLLATLEAENELLASDPTFISPDTTLPPRPPSLGQLREALAKDGITSESSLDFYAALVADPGLTISRFPDIFASTLRNGIPQSLRGYTYQAITSTSRQLAEAGSFTPSNSTSSTQIAWGLAEVEKQVWELLKDQSGTHDHIISHDISRTFPNVPFFKNSDGQGQLALGRVLRAYSVYDNQVSYCQGLAFLTGGLLLCMPERDAFCVLIRIMETHELRNLYLPGMSGLHSLSSNLSHLLAQRLPTISTHLANLSIEMEMFVTQWFLSMFAVTCPFELLTRILDVIVCSQQKAGDTMLQIAFALLQKNESRICALQEFEDVLRLLLSNEIWTAYTTNDEAISDFLSQRVTRKHSLHISTSLLQSSQPNLITPESMQRSTSGSSVTSSVSHSQFSDISSTSQYSTVTSMSSLDYTFSETDEAVYSDLSPSECVHRCLSKWRNLIQEAPDQSPTAILHDFEQLYHFMSAEEFTNDKSVAHRHRRWW